MPATSAALMLYRATDADVIEVLLVHPGGPFWARKDEGAWSIPKGEYTDGEDAHDAAYREFAEELGSAPSVADDDWLGEVRQPSGKRVSCWAAEGSFDVATVSSNTFDMEWPPRSGQTKSFPEVDRAEWFTVAAARQKILKGQVEFLDLLMKGLGPKYVEGATPP